MGRYFLFCGRREIQKTGVNAIGDAFVLPCSERHFHGKQFIRGAIGSSQCNDRFLRKDPRNR
jgi:hypothetical protein